jgi:hypothetical protein
MYASALGDLEHSLARQRNSLQAATPPRLGAVVAVIRREAKQ